MAGHMLYEFFGLNLLKPMAEFKHSFYDTFL